jgi:hypothetical protein
LKSVGITEYYPRGNVEILGDARKKQRLGLAIFAKTCIQRVRPKFEGHFGIELKPFKFWYKMDGQSDIRKVVGYNAKNLTSRQERKDKSP